ncbi:MAG: PIN domain-containing protein [archaeon]
MFDTYSFLEILKGNKNYEKYTDRGIVTTKLNLFELYLKILREENLESANKALEEYYPFSKDFDEEVIKDAAKLKKDLNIRDVSMTDCIGYCLAKQLGIKFLTGDRAFKDMANVEFVL